MRGVSTEGGDVVVLLGNTNDPEGVLRLAEGCPGDYSIDRSGKYHHVCGPVALQGAGDESQYRPRDAVWERDAEDGVWCGVANNHTHLSVWEKLRALRIVVE